MGDMAELTMTREEREAFLADTHVAVVGISEPGRAPLTVPVWYHYEPGGIVRIVTGRSSRKGKLLASAGRMSLCVQTETPPYKYVSVEGPVTIVPNDGDRRTEREMALRYLGPQMGEMYLASTADQLPEGQGIIVELRPARWYTVDYSKMSF
jgi:PPOX class probable F420-dependent enzyme